jgi:ADP-dependent NAD(P)H-hydrate dehydratase / NAD(P)H-hydrate epimerase
LGKTGAAVMTALAALKVGAGLVTLAIPSSLNSIVATKLTEAMTSPVDDEGRGVFCGKGFDQLREFAADRDLMVIGPGLGQLEETKDVVRRLFTEIDKPFVIDADGINAFVGHLDLFKDRPGRAVLTPHPGEFGRLAGRSPGDVNADRIEMGRAFAMAHKLHVVLKGAPTITFSPTGEAFFNPTGNPALAKGGTGDVLTGLVGGLMAQGYSMTEASVFGVYLHGYVADSWVETNTDLDLLAGDVIQLLGQGVRDIRNGTDRVYIERSL